MTRTILTCMPCNTPMNFMGNQFSAEFLLALYRCPKCHKWISMVEADKKAWINCYGDKLDKEVKP